MHMVVQEMSPKLINKAKRLSAQVGNTPIVRIKHLVSKKNVQLWVKQEWTQLSGSVKCRPAYRIFLDALEKGELTEHKTLLDATSGNTGIAYAAIGAALRAADRSRRAWRPASAAWRWPSREAH